MKINRLNASYGKLNNETMTFHEGLNIIYAPNESGKSTWCAFIRAMLYGVDSSERARAGYLPDKQRYSPWSGAPMEGVMDLTAERCDITISRSTRIQSAPMQEFSAVYTGTNTPVDKLTGTNCGEMLTGVTADVFRRSAFIEQGSAAVTGSPELEKRIRSILSTGDEETSFPEADARLKTWQHRRRFNRKGLIPDLEEKIDSAQQNLRDIEDSSAELSALEAKLDELSNECEELESQIIADRRSRRENTIARIGSAREEVNVLAAERDESLRCVNEKREALRKSVFNNRSLSDVESEADSDLRRVDDLRASAGRKNSPILMIIAFALTFALIAVYEFAFSHLAVIIAAAVSGIAGIIFLMRYMQNRRDILSAGTALRRLMKKYSVSSPEEITDILDEYHALNRSLEKAEKRSSEAREKYSSASAKLAELEAMVIKELGSPSEASEFTAAGKELAAKRSECAKLSSQISVERGRLMALGSPQALKAGLATMQQQLGKLQSEYDAISLAEATLKEADSEIQTIISPEIGKLAAKYMSEMTGGRYEQVLLDRNFSARAKTGEDIIAHDSGYLSAGTADLLYLAVRLAVCDLAFPSGESCPLIIDDALVNFDETRYEQAMKLLREISKERQVIFFTCRK